MDTEGLLKSLKEHKVDFVIIGATAFPVHGYARATLDIDIFIRPTETNAERVYLALKAFGYDVSDINKGELLSKKLLIRQYALETDIHPFVKGVTFAEVWKNKVRAKIGNTAVYFASLGDLIKMKRAAHRVKDLDDLKYLYKLKKDKNRRGRSPKGQP
jgi:predicted nucleotidyltransferase